MCSDSVSKICSEDKYHPYPLNWLDSTTKKRCERACNANKDCNFTVFYEDFGSCILLETCKALEPYHSMIFGDNAKLSVLAKNQCPGNNRNYFKGLGNNSVMLF